MGGKEGREGGGESSWAREKKEGEGEEEEEGEGEGEE